jgi:hypothetical protein
VATRYFTIHDSSRSADRATLLKSPRFFGFYDSSPSRDHAVFGMATARFRVFRFRDSSPSDDRAQLNRLASFFAHDSSPSRDRAFFPRIEVRTVAFALRDSSPSRDLAFLNRFASFAAHDSSPSRDTTRFAILLPPIAVPTDEQQWGTINLVANPSLEYDEVDLRGWSASGDGALTRTAAATAHVGEYSGRFAVEPAGAAPEVRIYSVRGLSETGYSRRWVASVGLRGDVPEFSMTLIAVYRDGSSDVSDTLFVDATSERPLNDDWYRYSTDPMSTDPVKFLEHFELFIETTSDPLVETILRIDGAQIEEALSGGATPYVDGDQGEGTRWLGAPGRSHSMRVTG